MAQIPFHPPICRTHRWVKWSTALIAAIASHGPAFDRAALPTYYLLMSVINTRALDRELKQLTFHIDSLSRLEEREWIKGTWCDMFIEGVRRVTGAEHA